MKKNYIIILFLSAGIIANMLCLPANAQGTWTQKLDFTGTARFDAVGFSIGTKGYVGTGGGGTNKQDFWEWDGDTTSATYNTWTQKADFGGGVRGGAVGFSIGKKGYMGTGNGSNGYKNDFWEWDGDTASANYNTWTKKNDFGGTPRWGAVGFSIGTKGYIGTGYDNINANKQDFWEWDQATGIWTQKLDFAGTPRRTAVGFSIGAKGYIGTGEGPVGTHKQDFWEWNQATNQWVQKTNFGGGARRIAAGFAIGTKGYIGTGYGTANTQDLWEWNQVTDVWTKMADFGGVARNYALGFSIGTRGYIGFGYVAAVSKKDFWEYNPAVPTAISENPASVKTIIFPNPFFTRAVLSLNKEVKNASLKIYNLSGQEVRIINFSGNQITLESEDLIRGVYFYQLLIDDKSVSAGKLIIQ